MDGIASWWQFVTDNQDTVWENTFDHLSLVVQAMLAATLVATVTGIVAHRVRALRGVLLGLVNVLLTIPSLALFSIFIPLVGLGFAPSFIALVLYALMPILRNTITGLESVDPAVSESAKGMGLGSVQRLVRVELPLAWPVMITGIRVATLLTTGIAAIAVLVGGPGLGRYIQDGLNRYPLPTSVERMWTGIVFTVALALALDLAYTLIRRLTTPAGIRS
jgi:osmoprotectant transport system permease protein